MGAVTVTKAGDAIPLGGTARLQPLVLTMSASYATNGDTVDLEGDVGSAEGRLIVGCAAGYVLEWDGSNQKIKAFRDNGTATAAALPEVAAAVNLSAVSTEAWALLPT